MPGFHVPYFGCNQKNISSCHVSAELIEAGIEVIEAGIEVIKLAIDN